MRKEYHTFEVPIEIQNHMKLFLSFSDRFFFLSCVEHEWLMLMRNETERLNWRFISFLRNMIGFDFTAFADATCASQHHRHGLALMSWFKDYTHMSRGNEMVKKHHYLKHIWWLGVWLSNIWAMFLLLATDERFFFVLPMLRTIKETKKRFTIIISWVSFINDYLVYGFQQIVEWPMAKLNIMCLRWWWWW